MYNLLIGAIGALGGLLLIALKLKSDENAQLKEQVFQLQNDAQLHPLNEQLDAVMKEVANAKKIYESALTGSDSSKSPR